MIRTYLNIAICVLLLFLVGTLMQYILKNISKKYIIFNKLRGALQKLASSKVRILISVVFCIAGGIFIWLYGIEHVIIWGCLLGIITGFMAFLFETPKS